MTKKLPSMRLLEAHGVPYTVLAFPETIRSARDVAAYCGLPPAQVYKTLVVLRSQGKPLLVMLPGDREIQLKHLAQTLGEKKLRMASQQEAEGLTGLKVGGISALALTHRTFPVYLDHTARSLETILVSAGQRGLDIRLSVADLQRLTGASLVEATLP